MSRGSEALKISPELMHEFQAESLESLEAIEADVVAYADAAATDSLLQGLFRCIHTIKGSASYLGLTELKDLTHVFESLLDVLRKRSDAHELLTSIGAISVFLEVIDRVRELVTDIEAGDPSRNEALHRKLEELARQVDGKPLRKESELTKAPVAETNLDSKAMAAFRDVTQQQIARLDEIMRKSDDFDRAPAIRAVQTLIRAIDYLNESPFLELGSNFSSSLEELKQEPPKREALAQTLSQLKSLIARHAINTSKASEQVKAGEGSTRETARFEKKTVRVEESLLDNLMNLVAELIVTRNSLQHWHSRVAPELMESQQGKELREISHRLASLSAEMQTNVSRVRWVPIGMLFNRYARVVRDLCEKTGKDVRFQTEGEETGIDKGLVEHLSEPLIHLVRNSLDHGIETPDERRRKGKDPSGSLTLRASQRGGMIQIEVVDDGRGIDPEHIGRKAVEKGLVSPEQLKQMVREDVLNLIFAPGFSTSDSVTEISGRGVGMDAVMHGIKKVNGKVNIDTRPGEGTRLTLEFPLTLAVTEALLVSLEEDVFAIPLQFVHEIVRIRREQITMLVDQPVMSLRGQVINAIPLKRILQSEEAPRTERDSEIMDGQSAFSVVVQCRNQKCALLIDRVLRKEEIVVKPLPPNTTQGKAASGAAILGDGRAILILDPNQF